jgi:hypothetical protein
VLFIMRILPNAHIDSVGRMQLLIIKVGGIYRYHWAAEV